MRGLKFLIAEPIDGDISRTPSGVRGLKYVVAPGDPEGDAGRTPSGVRGLKLSEHDITPIVSGSHPVRGAWIEIYLVELLVLVYEVAPRQGCVD